MTVNIVMTGYVPEGGDAQHPRARYARQSACSLLDKLLCNGVAEDFRFIYANDGPGDQPHVATMSSLVKGGGTRFLSVCGPRRGIGGSLNRALQHVLPDDLWLYTTDDWVLTEQYPLDRAWRLIRELNYDYVRLGPPHPNVTAVFRYEQGMGFWLDLDPSAGGFAFATRPFLAHKSFYDMVGKFEEECDAYVCERDYADRVMGLGSALNCAEIVVGSLEGPWRHIGKAEVGARWP